MIKPINNIELQLVIIIINYHIIVKKLLLF